MKCMLVRLFLSLLLATIQPALAAAAGAPPAAADTAAIRLEFDQLFAASPIYQAIRKNLPEVYEKFFHSYLDARQAGREDFQVGGFINSIRNTYLKQSSDESLFAFFRYTVDVGREILNKDPEAAFAYIFGGDPAAYVGHLDFAAEQKRLGELYDQILSTRAAENLEHFDRSKAEEGMDYVNVLLFFKHGENFQLLQKDIRALSAEERQCLCTLYLDMFNEIFHLAPVTRSSVLRSFASRMG